MRRPALLGLALLLLGGGGAGAVETRFWEVGGPRGFLEGELDGVSLRPQGELLLAPDLLSISLQTEEAPPQPFLWDTVLDGDGNLYVGSGVQGIVYKVDPQGGTSIAFVAPERQVHALAIDSRGDLLVGASSPGRIYRIGGAEETPVLLLETGERFIWDMAVGRDDRLYVATGEKGVLLSVSRDGEPEVLFDADEPHLTSLALDVDGSVIVGSAGTGLIYEIDPDGRAQVLFDAAGEEVSAVTLLPSGTVYAAVNTVVLPEEKDDDERKRPQERLAGEMPQGPSLAPRGVEDLPGDEEDVELPDSSQEEVLPLRSVLYRIPPVGPPQVVWRSETSGIHSLHAAAPERIYFGTGVPGGLYLLDPREDEEPRLVARFAESQLTSIAVGVGGQLYAVTSNEGRLYRSSADFGSSGSYLSAVLDAGGNARWGQVWWEAETPAGSRVELATRSGSSARPDDTWSGWSPAYSLSKGTPVISPPGRYLQFRARLSRLGESETPRLRSVGLSYREDNLPPQVEDLQVQAGASTEGSAPQEYALTWSASDPNGDRLLHGIAMQGPERGEWSDVAEVRDMEYVWKTRQLAEGHYRLRVTTSDEPDNDADTALHATALSGAVLVDHTPPQIEVLSRSGESGTASLRLLVTDGVSPVVRADYSLDGGPTQRLRPEDGLDDSREERYQLRLGDLPSGPRRFRIRVTDRAGNRRTTTLTVEVSP